MEYTIAQHLAIAIFNDEWSDICASDEKHAEIFVNGLDGYLVPLDMEAEWARCEITGLHNDCVTVFLMRN